MASNKNQHFVPRCYLRPFTLDSGNKVINVFNIDRIKFIENAPVKHQCSGSYFYGDDLQLEKAMQIMEGEYSKVLRAILKQGYVLTDDHRAFLKHFWLLQHSRTEAASKRMVEMTNAAPQVIGIDHDFFRLKIRDAVQIAMKNFPESTKFVDDLKVCLLRNKTKTPFITSDDPAILTNRWYIERPKEILRSFGIISAGAIIILPITPQILCVGYDGDVHSFPHENGWIIVRRDSDVHAFNQHQFLNCWANIYFQDASHANLVRESFLHAAQNRPESRYKINYAVFDGQIDGYKRFKVVNPKEAGDHENGIIHWESICAKPISWPVQLSIKSKGFGFTNNTGLGYIRRALIDQYPGSQPFRKVSIFDK